MKRGLLIRFMNKDFPFLDKREDRLFMIVSCLVISILFVNIFVPLNVNRWYSDKGFIQFMRLSSYGIVIGLVFLFTQFPLRKWFGIIHFKIKTYLLWLLIELSLISIVYIFMYGNPVGNFVNEFIFSLRYTFLGILVPYLFSLLVLFSRRQRFEIKHLKTSLLKKHSGLISLKDENRQVRISLADADLLFLESADNYVSILYLNEGHVKKSLIRNNLKALEDEQLPENIIRCHRSYMINLKNVEYIQKYKRSYQVKIKGYNILLPVSQKYKAKFQDILV